MSYKREQMFGAVHSTRFRIRFVAILCCLLVWSLCSTKDDNRADTVLLSPLGNLEQDVAVTSTTAREFSRDWPAIHDLFLTHAPVFESMKVTRCKFAELKFRNFYDENDLIDSVNISASDLLATTRIHTSLLQSLPAYPEGSFAGRGYVILSGGTRYTRPSLMTLYLMRRQFMSSLPIEVWMKDESEYDEKFCAMAVKFDATCKLLSDHMTTEQLSAYTRSGFQLKPLTILFSSLEEIVFMDADNLPGMDLDLLFEWERYRRDGLVIWPDYSAGSRSPVLNQITGLQTTFLRSCESGQLVWNKRMHWHAVLLTVYYNLHGPRFYWPLLTLNGNGQGDKETYLFAAQVLNLPYYFVERRLHTFSMTYKSSGKKMFGGGFGQANPLTTNLIHEKYGPTGEVVEQKEMWCAFMHAHKPKYDARGIFVWAHPEESTTTEAPIQQEFERHGSMLYETHEMGSLMQNSLTFVEGMDFELVILRAFEWIECQSDLALDDQGLLCGAVRDVLRQKQAENENQDYDQALAAQLVLESQGVDNKYMWD